MGLGALSPDPSLLRVAEAASLPIVARYERAPRSCEAAWWEECPQPHPVIGRTRRPGMGTRAAWDQNRTRRITTRGRARIASMIHRQAAGA